MKTRIWPILIASSLGLALLLWLGMWQVQRLAWKNELLRDQAIASTTKSVPIDIALALFAEGKRIEYMRTEVTGEFVGKPVFLLTSFHGQPAWNVIAPLNDTKRLIIIDLGVIPEGSRNSLVLPSGKFTLTGQLLTHSHLQGSFDPDHTPSAESWYWWDVDNLAAAFSQRTELETSKLIFHVEPGSGVGSSPVPQKLSTNLRNNHLGYAITWFGLAIVLVVMTGVFIYKQRQTTK